MIIDMHEELRDFTYISNLYKCISNYHLMGHQIGRKVGDMLEILTMGMIYKNINLKNHLNIEGKLEGYTTAGHKVEFGFFENPRNKTNLFGAIECKCVGVEETKFNTGHIKTLCLNESFEISLSARQWLNTPITVTIKLLSINDNTATIELSNSSTSRIQPIPLNIDENVKLIVDENQNFINTTPHGNMITEIPTIIRICKTIKLKNINNNTCTFSLWNCLTGPQTIEKAKQASLVAMDLRKKIDGHWGKEDLIPNSKKMTFIHVLCELSHWEEKSRNVINTCIDYNLVIPDKILIYAFNCFEETFGLDNMLSYISKSSFKNNTLVQNLIYNVIDYFEDHILYDISQNQYVALDNQNNKLIVKPL